MDERERREDHEQQLERAEERLLAVTRLIERGFNSNEWGLLDEVVAEDLIVHVTVPSERGGREGWKQALMAVRAAFPDGYVRIDDVFVSGDSVARMWTFTGTQTGDFFGLPPTGRAVEISGVDVERLAGGRIVEHWSFWDGMELMRQLGAGPDVATPGTSS